MYGRKIRHITFDRRGIVNFKQNSMFQQVTWRQEKYELLIAHK